MVDKPEHVVPYAVEIMAAGAIEPVMRMYELNAVFVGPGGEVASGHDELREALTPFVALKPQFTLDIDQVVEAGDVAEVCGRWSLTGADSEGKTVEMSGRNVDVVRRQADGSWLIVIDNPFYGT